jgi:hypothetical protein
LGVIAWRTGPQARRNVIAIVSEISEEDVADHPLLNVAAFPRSHTERPVPLFRPETLRRRLRLGDLGDLEYFQTLPIADRHAPPVRRDQELVWPGKWNLRPSLIVSTSGTNGPSSWSARSQVTFSGGAPTSSSIEVDRRDNTWTVANPTPSVTPNGIPGWISKATPPESLTDSEKTVAIDDVCQYSADNCQ